MKNIIYGFIRLFGYFFPILKIGLLLPSWNVVLLKRLVWGTPNEFELVTVGNRLLLVEDDPNNPPVDVVVVLPNKDVVVVLELNNVLLEFELFPNKELDENKDPEGALFPLDVLPIVDSTGDDFISSLLFCCSGWGWPNRDVVVVVEELNRLDGGGLLNRFCLVSSGLEGTEKREGFWTGTEETVDKNGLDAVNRLPDEGGSNVIGFFSGSFDDGGLNREFDDSFSFFFLYNWNCTDWLVFFFLFRLTSKETLSWFNWISSKEGRRIR